MDGAAQGWGSGKPLHGIPCAQQRRQPEKDRVFIVLGCTLVYTHREYTKIDFILRMLQSLTNTHFITQILTDIKN